MNDFPYGFEEGIIHIVVWTKISVPKLDSGLADITPEARQTIQHFVDSTFKEALSMDSSDILWFKNWAALMSIRDLDHFHVLLNKPPVDDRLLNILSEDDNVKQKWAAIDSRVKV